MSLDKPISLNPLSNTLSNLSLQNLYLSVLRLIFQFCDTSELVQSKSVCKQFQVALNHHVAWDSAILVMNLTAIQDFDLIRPESVQYVKRAVFICSYDLPSQFNPSEWKTIVRCFQTMSHLKRVHIQNGGWHSGLFLMNELLKSNYKGTNLVELNWKAACLDAEELASVFPNLQSLWLDTLFVKNNIQNCPNWFPHLKALNIRQIRRSENEFFEWTGDKKSRPECSFPELKELACTARYITVPICSFHAPNLQRLVYPLMDHDTMISESQSFDSFVCLQELHLVYWGPQSVPMNQNQIDVLQQCTTLLTLNFVYFSSVYCPNLAAVFTCTKNMLNLKTLVIRIEDCQAYTSEIVTALSDIEFSVTLESVAIELCVLEVDQLVLKPLQDKWHAFFENNNNDAVKLKSLSCTFIINGQGKHSFCIERTNHSVQSS